MLIRAWKAQRKSADSGDGYLASSADLMIGLLFVFIIMVVYLAVEIKTLKDSADRVPIDPLAGVINVISDGMRKHGVTGRLDPRTGVLALSADALFDQGQSKLTPDGDKAVMELKAVLEDELPCFVRASRNKSPDCDEKNPRDVYLETVMVEGHTDSKPFRMGAIYANGMQFDNWHLGLDRAHTVFSAIQAGPLGDATNDKGQPLIGLASYADTRPANEALVGMDPDQVNRRVELRFILSYEPKTGPLAGAGNAAVTAVKERLESSSRN